MRGDRGGEFTQPGTPWLGQPVFCLASGPSLARMPGRQWARIWALQKTGAKVIAVNSSVKTARDNHLEADALFFTDGNWFDDNRDLIAAFRGDVYTVCRRAKATIPDRIKRIENVHRPDFTIGQAPMKDGRSSGHRAISLGILLGGAPVIGLGYDMKLDAEGRSHCHDDYERRHHPELYTQDFIPAFAGWNAAAKAAGVRVINATPDSALEEFERADLEAVLDELERRHA